MRGVNPAVLSVTGGRGYFVTRSEGGAHDSAQRCHHSLLPYLSHSAVVSCCESDPSCRTGKKGGDESAPPKKKRGGACDPDSGTEWHTAIRPHGVALVLIYPCGKARIGGADAPETGTSLVPRIQ